MTVEVLDEVALAWIGLAVPVFVLLMRVTAPYGRHTRGGWGPTVGRTAGWVLMEAPASLLMFAFFAAGRAWTDAAAWAFLAMWQVHYVNRAFVYPFRLRGGNARMPLVIALMGMAFNLVNGSLQGAYLFLLGPERGASWLADPRFVAGLAVFAGGMALNMHSDAVLRALRREPGEAYKIPRGGGFRFVTCPNYLGEIVEWCGWALATWSLPGLAFAVWTAANLVPRAVSNHRWYHERFQDYPKDRKILVPGLF